MLPSVRVQKVTGGNSPSTNSSDGILAIIASCATGTDLPPTMLTNQALAVSTFGGGMLVECAAYDINVSGQPALAVPLANPSVLGTYGAITKAIAGSGTVTEGSTAPLLHYDVEVTVQKGFTVGAAGGTVTWSVDGGDNVQGPVQVPTSGTLALGNTGVSFTLTGTFAQGDTWSCFTERPMANNADVSSALATLGTTRLPWEGVLIDAVYGTGTVGLVDEFLGGLEAKGQYCFGLLNTRFMNEPSPTAETPTVYATAMIAQTENDASDRIVVGADGGHMTSTVTGFTTKMPTSLAVGARAMQTTPNIGTDPAQVDLGPIPAFTISSGSNPLDWDEDLYESLDDARLATLRSFAPGGPVGTYITNANVLISSGSNIYWLQLLRVLNKGCRIAFKVLTTQLSKGVRTVFNDKTQAVNIDPRDAQTIEHLVQSPLASGLSGQCTETGFDLHTDDDLSTAGAPCNGDVLIVPLVYLKDFVVKTALVKTISASAATGG